MPSLDFSQAWPWLQWVIAVAAVLAFVGAAIRVIPSVWRFVHKFVQTVDALGDLPDDLEKNRVFRDETKQTLEHQDKQLATLKHEVFPNSGASLRDAVNRIEKKLTNDDDRLLALEKKDKS